MLSRPRARTPTRYSNRTSSIGIAVTFGIVVLLLVPVGSTWLASTLLFRGSPTGPPPTFGVASWIPSPVRAHLGVATPDRVLTLRDLSSALSGPMRPAPAAAAVRLADQAAAGAGSAPLATSRPASLAVGAGFEGLNDTQCGCAPPDVINAAGPPQVFEMVNLWVEA